MRARERLSCGVGNVFNDLFRQLGMAFEDLIFHESGGTFSVASGSDNTHWANCRRFNLSINWIPWRQSQCAFFIKQNWPAGNLGTLSQQFLWQPASLFCSTVCFLCDGRDQLSWLPLAYFSLLSALVNICYNMVEINHLAFISTVAEKVEECTALSAVRTVFTFLSGVYVYIIAWALLGQDSGDLSLGRKNLLDFAVVPVLDCIWNRKSSLQPFSTSAQRNPKACKEIYYDIYGFYDARKTIMAHVFVDMLMASSYDKRQEDEGREATEELEQRQRKRSFLQKIRCCYI
ncbi:Major facilitator super domain-containing protein 12 [Desmophyllum pertusum]|uniref:Major facilitator super domain-containing protein 12 n=1 Tax=Desmophyllum pertusum TaxID=174260 RepID=A0A9X0D2H1_9CNID|nr:Major facilitator super domain-containing protein 12 [Desmophyllum pertusum]